MSTLLNKILLIDDDKNTNFYNEYTIKKLNLVREIIAFQNGKEALEYLGTTTDGNYPRPDIIFLDINMPVMNGWQFLEEYNKLGDAMKAKVVITMLTSSLNPDNLAKAEQYTSIKGFITKPLSKEDVLKLVEKHLPSGSK